LGWLASSVGYDLALFRGDTVKHYGTGWRSGWPGPDHVGMQLVAKRVGRSGWRRRWEVAVPVLLLSGAWALVAGVHLLGVWIANWTVPDLVDSDHSGH
jgi:hypothetical protein